MSRRLGRELGRGVPSRRGAAALALLGALGCDSSFDPIAESERNFSVFGYLDASADTQWIRVLPIRPLIFTSAASLGVTASLEELGSGRILPLRDSVFQYSYGPSLGADSVSVHNYWTTERIQAGEVYRFRATGLDGVSSEAEIPVPSDYSVTVLINTRPRPGNITAPEYLYDAVRLAGVNHLAFVRVLAHLRNSCGPWVYPIDYTIPEGSFDPHTVPVRKAVPSLFGLRPARCGADTLDKLEIWTVGTASPWPRGARFSTGALDFSDLPTNVTNAVGFVGGVLTKVVPYESCSWAGRAPLPQTCELTYGSEHATLTGIVRDACTNRLVPNATVRLETLLADPSAPRKVRSAVSTFSPFGAYRIQGLEPGTRYALTVSHPETTAPETPLFRIFTDTLELAPEEQRRVDIGLERTDASLPIETPFGQCIRQ